MKNTIVLDAANLPSTPALLVPSQLTPPAIAALREALGDRQIAFVKNPSGTYEDPLIAAAGDDSIIEISPSEGGAGLDMLKKAIESGITAIFLPSNATAWPASGCYVPSAMLKKLVSAGVPTVPVSVDTPQLSHLTVENPAELPEAIVAIGEVIEGDAVNMPAFQEALFRTIERAFSERPLFKGSLGWAVIQGLKKHSTNRIIDGTDGSELPYDKLLAAAMVLAKKLKAETSKPRVAIVLPPGKGVFVANVAVLLAGKVPVNLNFTAGADAVNSSVDRADIDRFITGSPMLEKFEKFPWPDASQQILLDQVLPKLKLKIALCLLRNKYSSAEKIAARMGITNNGDRDEATLLFTSGSSGQPKGVVLTHRNVLGNVNQFAARLNMKAGEDTVLGCLPLFHSFGCTVTMWFPLIEGIGIVTYPSPLDPPKLADLVEEHKVTLLLSTPTFFRGYLRKVEPEKLRSVKLVVSGAEKLPPRLNDAFKKKFGHDILEGYGLTETSPVSNANLPNLDGEDALPSHRIGSVGQIVPGMAVRFTDAQTDEPVPYGESGIIWFRGANVFGGYLGEPEKTADVFDGDWFRTGDLGRIDEDGFLFIEGRLSRFSKIAGEMVPHETVEDHINKALGLDNETERKIAVVGVPDEAKGEALLLLSTLTDPPIDEVIAAMRPKLLEAGVAALWIPKKAVAIDKVPLLASGKLDIKGCEDLAKG